MDSSPIFLTLNEQMRINKIPLIVKEDIEFEQILGKGGQGSVYKGQIYVDNQGAKLKKTVAIKKIQVTFNNILNTIRELQFLALGKSLCTSLVTIYGINLEQNSSAQDLIDCNIIMELLPYSLHDYIYNPNLNKSNQTKIKILQQIADGLQYLHTNDIVHRDIKPLNILLDEQFNVNITDLGVSRLMPKNVEIMETQMFSGTNIYASPESFLENKYTFKSDMWCFGLVAFELFTESRPWTGKTFSFKNFLSEISPLPEDWEQAIDSPEAIKVIKRTVVYDRDERHSASQVKKYLTPVLWQMRTLDMNKSQGL